MGLKAANVLYFELICVKTPYFCGFLKKTKKRNKTYV